MASQKRIYGLGAAIVILVLVLIGWNAWQRSTSSLPYTIDEKIGSISRLADDLGPVTQIKFSPDGSYFLVALLTGEVYGFVQTTIDGQTTWVKQAEPVLTITTAFPGFPPEENGLIGLAFAADYETSREIFFTYAFRAGEDDIRNRVARTEIILASDLLVADGLTDIYELKTPGNASHQIEGAVGILVENISHVMFGVGEGFEADRALDVAKEAGKLMLIRRDGSDPAGPRPYPTNPKIQAIGFRNPPDLAINQFDPEQRLAIVDTGPDTNDRFIYAKFIDLIQGKAVTGLDLGWDGTSTSLAESRPDQNSVNLPNSVLYRWEPAHTATNIVFHPGKGQIPTSTKDQATVFASLFGRTGETGRGKPGREIWLGTLTTGTEPAVSWQLFITRSKKGVGEVGHPLGLAIDPNTDDIVFGDIMEGSIYWVHINE